MDKRVQPYEERAQPYERRMTHVLYRVYSTITRDECFTSTTEHDFVKIQQSCS